VKLQAVDDLIRPQHSYLGKEDRAYFLREYTARAGFSYGETNDIITNLKKSVDRRERPEWHYKERDIQRAGEELRAALGEKTLQTVTIVPMPPSKAKADPLYDDRLLRIVQLMTDGLNCDVRELILQHKSTAAAHERSDRPGPQEYYDNYFIDENLVDPAPTRLLVVDDVLTTGAHFVGIKRRLGEKFPNVAVFGCFFARRIFPPEVSEDGWVRVR